MSYAQLLHSRTRVRAKHVLFIVLGLMSLFILYHDEGFFIHHESNTWKFFYPVRMKLFFHATGGAIALTVGALQFSARLRQQRPAVHRLLGRTYLAGVLVAAPVAVYLAFTHALAIMATGTSVQASLWVLTTLMAIRATRNKNFDVHKQWMMRSYAVTLLFVANRIILALPVLAPTSDVGAERLAWVLIVCALLVPQLIIDRQQLFVPNSTTRTQGLPESPSK